jgi:hypothetical protein
MAQIPEYFRNKLESSRTGIASADHSGARIAESVKGLADTFFQGIVQLEAVQKKNLDDSRRAQINGDYQTRMVEETNRIRNENLKTPDKATDQLNKRRQELRDEYLSAIDDGALKAEVSRDFDVMEADAQVKDAVWKVSQTSLIAQQNHLDLISRNAQALATLDYQNYLEKASMLMNSKDQIAQSFGGIEQGQKTVDKGLEAYTKAFIYGQIDRGNTFEAAQLLQSGKFDPFITAEKKKELLSYTQTAFEGQQKKDIFLTAVRASSEIFDTAKQETFDNTTVSNFEEKISQLSFDIQNAVEQGKPEETINALKIQQETLTTLRDIKLKATDITDKQEDIGIKGQALARFQALILPTRDPISGDKDIALNKKATLDDVMKYQRWLTEQRYEQKISPETYQKYMTITEAAIQRSIVGNLKESGEGFKLSGRGAQLAGAKKLKTTLADLMRSVDRTMGKQYAVDVIDFYLDELYDRVGESEDFGMVGNDTHKELMNKAKAKSALKRLGYPVYLTVGDTLVTSSGAYLIKGQDASGNPVVDISNTLFGVQ